MLRRESGDGWGGGALEGALHALELLGNDPEHPQGVPQRRLRLGRAQPHAPPQRERPLQSGPPRREPARLELHEGSGWPREVLADPLEKPVEVRGGGEAARAHEEERRARAEGAEGPEAVRGPRRVLPLGVWRRSRVRGERARQPRAGEPESRREGFVWAGSGWFAERGLGASRGLRAPSSGMTAPESFDSLLITTPTVCRALAHASAAAPGPCSWSSCGRLPRGALPRSTSLRAAAAAFPTSLA